MFLNNFPIFKNHSVNSVVRHLYMTEEQLLRSVKLYPEKIQCFKNRIIENIIMLPKCTKAIKKFEDFMVEFMVMRVDQLIYPFSKSPKTRLFEGDNDFIIRNDGSTDKTEFKEIKGTVAIAEEETENLNINEIFEKLNEAAKQMAEQQFKHSIDVINEATQKTGNIVNIKGELTPQHFFQLIEKIWLEFNEKGEPEYPSILTGTQEVVNNFQKVLMKIDTDKALKKEYEILLLKKKDEYNARENSRKLVG